MEHIIPDEDPQRPVEICSADDDDDSDYNNSKGYNESLVFLVSRVGEKIGACFFNPSAEKDTSVVFALVTILMMTTDVAQQVAVVAVPRVNQAKTTKMKLRIFVGVVQPCRGYAKPKIKLLKAELHAKFPCNVRSRSYVGERKSLF